MGHGLQPGDLPVQRLPGQDSILGGAGPPGREVDLGLTHAQGAPSAVTRDPVLARQPVVSGIESNRADSIVGPVHQQGGATFGIADAEGTQPRDARTGRNGTMASRLSANQYFTEASAPGSVFPDTKDSDVYSFLAGPQQGRSTSYHPVTFAGAPTAAGLGASAPLALCCDPHPLGASGGL